MDIAYNKVDQTALPIDTTRVSASEYNQIAGSLMSIISASGLTPDSADNTQLLNALKAMGSGWAMPSNIKDTLTVGASGVQYTAPANGYFLCQITATSASASYANIVNVNTGERASLDMARSGSGFWGFVSAKRGEKVQVAFGSSTFNSIYFIYAEGSKSEQEES